MRFLSIQSLSPANGISIDSTGFRRSDYLWGKQSDPGGAYPQYCLEVAKYGITVNCVSPGPTQTGWIDEEFEKVVIPLIPMGKLIQPDDIAETILFLSGKQAGVITGQVIKVSGGKSL